MPADERYHVQTGDTLTDRCAFGLTTAALTEFNSLHDADAIFCGTVPGLRLSPAPRRRNRSLRLKRSVPLRRYLRNWKPRNRFRPLPPKMRAW